MATQPAQQNRRTNGCKKNTGRSVVITLAGQSLYWEVTRTQSFRPQLLKHVGLSFICLAFGLSCTVYCTFPSACLIPDLLCRMNSDISALCLFCDTCYCTLHTFIPACSVKLLLGLKLSKNCNCILDDSNDSNCIVFVLPDIPSWILKDDRKSRSLVPNIFKFNGVRIIFMFVIYY